MSEIKWRNYGHIYSRVGERQKEAVKDWIQSEKHSAESINVMKYELVMQI